MIIKNCNFISNIKKILKFLSNILAWGPAIIVISSLISIFLILPFTLLPIKEVKIFNEKSLPFFILEFIILALMSYYGYRIYSKIKNNKIAVSLYCLVLILSIVLVFYYRYRFVILLQPALPLVYAIIFEEKLFKIRDFFSTSKVILTSLNIFDLCYIFIFQWFTTFENLSDFQFILSLVILFIISPIFRTLWLCLYIKQFKKVKSGDNTYFSSYITMFLISFFQLLIFAMMFLIYQNSKDKSIINLVSVYMILETIFIYFWAILKTQIDRGGFRKKDEFLRWTLGIITILFIFVYDKIEGEFLVILSWLLPVLISTIIGELHYQFVKDETSQLPRLTLKMKQHVYWLQLISFLTLFCLNLFSALFTIQKIKNNEIISENIAKASIINFINPSDKELASVWMSSITTSFMIISLSFILAMALSVGLVKLLKLNYSDSAKGYYKYRNSRLSTLINRKYKRNIHKRRKNNV